MALDILLQEAQDLSEETLMEVVRFMRFIKTENAKPSGDHTLDDAGRLRKAGLYRGQIRMSQDFDAPMPEFREYM